MSLIKARPLKSDATIDFGNRLRSQPRPHPTFVDGIASLAPRHDNDHAHFRDIKIWPTTDEILAVDAPVFMPKKDDGAPNPISPGPERLLDLLFRHYRFESTESIKNVCYSAAQTAFLEGTRRDRYIRGEARLSSIASSHIDHDPNTIAKRETSAGHRYFLYNNVRVEELEAHEHYTILIRLSFDCPIFMRSKMIHQMGRFEEGMLIAVLLLNRTNNELSMQFLQIHRVQSTMSMDPRGGKGRKAAVQAILLPGAATEDALFFARLAQNLEPDTEIYMVEFPKLLPTAIYSPLKRMQQMHGFAFDDYLAPRRTLDNIMLAQASNANPASTAHFHCPAPAYARGHDFTYDLSPVLTNVDTQTKTTFTVRELTQQSTLDTLRTSSVLDDGQAVAFQHCLTSEFAFTQGPPGTGKTYLGIQLTKALLKSRPHQKPIVVVCLTNHALDSFLAGLRDAGITNLLRIGNGSKEEWTQAFSLRQRSRKVRLTAQEYQMKQRLQNKRNSVFASIHDWCRGASSQTLTGTLGWYAVDRLLASNNPSLHRQLKLTDNPASQKFLFEHWAEGGDLQALRQLRNRLASNHHGNTSTARDGPTADEVITSIYKAAEAVDEQAGSQSIWQMTTKERRALLDQWKNDIDPEQLANELAESFADYQATKDSLGTLRELIDLRAMDQASVIGITTTSCATRAETLRSLGVEVVICEEAGEVMEPHALLALLPTVQHAIFIGDPLQLRPEVSEQRLVLERSSDYRLNESLFERMIVPRDPSAEPLAFAQLTIQRRMHPDIAEIPRIIYPTLLDHDSTHSHEPTVGIEERMFWWDHRAPELEETNTNKSHVNEHEVGMVTGLVGYLLKGSAYSQGDIAVLTAYSGQLAELHKALSRTCKVWLNDKDRNLLLEEEALDIEPTELRKKNEVRVSDMLRLTTVDNFQGEEAAIVIISTVRSGNRPGFLASENRINVACSRARNGFYIIGNSKTLSTVPMWRSVLNVFGTRRGPSLMTYCSNHPQHRSPVTQPSDFASIMDCPVTCGKALPCGHTCAENCHPMKLHEDDIMPCTQPCQKILSCTHQCTRPCGVDCGACLISVDEVTLPCGHKGSVLCSGDVPACGVILDEITLDCGHRVQRVCGDDHIEDHACAEPCSKVLDCGHNCTGTCSECRRVSHPSCSGSCGRSLPCGHACLALCGHEDDCPPCKNMTRIVCEHESKTQGCRDPPWICLAPQSTPCEHVTDSNTPCFLPQASVPCPELCTKLLGCGHQCPSLHGEVCIPETHCPLCLKQPTFTALVYVQECSHVVSVKELDQLNLQDVYELDEAGTIIGYGAPAFDQLHKPKCVCGGPCQGVLRYHAIGKMAEMDGVLERAFGYMIGERFCRHAKQAALVERELALSYENWKMGIRPEAVASVMNSRRIQDRHNDLLELKGKLVDYHDKYVAPVEKATTQLHGCMPSAFPYNMTMQLRYSIIGLRLSAAMVVDSLRMARHLSSLTDPTLMTQRMSEILLQTTTHGAEASRRYCKELQEMDACEDAPALYCELHLRQIHLWLLVDYSLGKMSNETLVVEEIDEASDDGLEEVQEMLDILDLVVEISNLFPNSCGSFYVTALHFKQLLQLVMEGQRVGTIPTVDITNVRRVEDRFGRYGHAKEFAVCEEGHWFFEDVFGEDGCPECDSKVVLNRKPEYDHGKHLFEDQFLVAMEAITSQTSSPAKSLSRKQGQEVANGIKSGLSSSASSSQPFSGATPVMPQTSTETSSDSAEKDADGEATPCKTSTATAVATPVKKSLTDEEKFLMHMADLGWKFGRAPDEPEEPEKVLTNEEKFLKYMADQGWKFGQEFDENDGFSPLKKDIGEPEEPEEPDKVMDEQ